MPTKQPLGLEEFKKFLLPCTARFLNHELVKQKRELSLLIGHGSDDVKTQRNTAAHYGTTRMVERKMGEIAQLLKRPIYNPKGQTEIVSLGNGVTLSINGTKRDLFVDSSCVGVNPNIVSLESPLGKALFGKKKGEMGVYPMHGTHIGFKVLDIKPYSKAKQILKRKGLQEQVVETDFDPEVCPV